MLLLLNRISDFGEARGIESIQQTMTMTAGIGTPFYMAPEMMNNSKHYTSAIDVYSYGIMAAQVMTGKLTFGDNIDFDSPYGLFLLK